MSAEPYQNTPTAPPDIDLEGQAWHFEPDMGEESADIGASWLVHAPFSHPIWYWYVVTSIHLRPLPTQGSAVITRPGASHEMTIMALHPDKPIPDMSNWRGAGYLYPPDLIHQFIVRDDEQAKELAEMVVRHICEGHSADADFASYWHQLIDNTAEHFYYGCHPSHN